MAADYELLDAWRSGDQTAGTKLFNRHFSALYRFFRNKAPDVVDDLVQQTFLGCLEGRERMRGEASFRTYMFAVARNQLFRHWNKRNAAREQLDFETKSLHDLAPSASSVMAKRAEERLLLEALRRIPIEFQIALEFYYFENMRGPEIATILEVPEATVRSRIRRGLEHLKRHMQQLASSPDILQSTLMNLDRWAENIRGAVDQPASD